MYEVKWVDGSSLYFMNLLFYYSEKLPNLNIIINESSFLLLRYIDTE